jgi:hypothetical protein
MFLPRSFYRIGTDAVTADITDGIARMGGFILDRLGLFFTF